MNALIQTTRQVLLERHKPWCIVFKVENSSQDSSYGISFTVVMKPETDAVLVYEGSGANFDDAFEQLRINVVTDFPKENHQALA